MTACDSTPVPSFNAWKRTKRQPLVKVTLSRKRPLRGLFTQWRQPLPNVRRLSINNPQPAHDSAGLGLSFVLFGSHPTYEHWTWSVAIFTVAAITDWLDGYLARRLNLGSTLGRNLDPLVDKVLICGAYIFLCRSLIRG